VKNTKSKAEKAPQWKRRPIQNQHTEPEIISSLAPLRKVVPGRARTFSPSFFTVILISWYPP